MAKYCIKAASFDAVQWDEKNLSAVEVVVQDGAALEVHPDHLRVITADGAMRAAPGDWVVRDHRGGVITCKPAVFEATYERVS